MNQVKCPRCLQVLGIPETEAGAKLRCPNCQAMFRMPDAPAAAPPPANVPPEAPRAAQVESLAEGRSSPKGASVAKPKRKVDIRFGRDEEGMRMPGELMLAIGFLALNIIGALMHLTGASAAAFRGPAPHSFSAVMGILVSSLAIAGIFLRQSIAWWYCANILPFAGGVLFFFPLSLLVMGQDDLALPQRIPKAALLTDMLLFAAMASLALLLRSPGVEAYFQWDGPVRRARARPLPPWVWPAVAGGGLVLIIGYVVFSQMRTANRPDFFREREAREREAAQRAREREEAADRRADRQDAPPKRNGPRQARDDDDDAKPVAPARPERPSKPRLSKPPRAVHAASELPGLTAYFPFDEGDGISTLEKIGGKQVAFENCAWTEGVRGKALAFDGESALLALDQTDALEFEARKPFTIALWFNSPGQRGYLLSLREANDRFDKPLLDLFINPVKQLEAQLRDGGSRGIPWSAKADLTAGWHHMALTRSSAGNVTLYLDGEPTAKGPFDKPRPGAINAELRRLGQNPVALRGAAATRSWFDGAIDEFAVFSRALSEDDVGKLAERERGD